MSKSALIPESRLATLREGELGDGDYILYHMQTAQRAEQNHALEYAVRKANEQEKGLLVSFGLHDDFPEANRRHFAFMLEGLEKTADALRRRGIGFVLRKGSPAEVAAKLSKQATEVVIDRGYLRYNREFAEALKQDLKIPLTQVETEPPVPHSLITDKQEYAARTIRPKIMKKLQDHLVWLDTTSLNKDSLGMQPNGEEFEGLLDSLNLEDVPPVKFWKGGTVAARAKFQHFLEEDLKRYDELRNQPHKPCLSHMSPYLHFGQISPAHVLLMLQEHDRNDENTDSYIEELAVRRTLSQNFCLYCEDYDKLTCVPDWAYETLQVHKDDEREHVYTREQLENAETHDPYWNAAQKEMVHTGYMHNHMRMYWGKQIITWTQTPEYAYKTTLYLNNKYFLDGRDPNSFGNVGWLFGLHDQGWKERAIYGKVRCMTQGGLKRKCDPEAYVKWVERKIEGSDIWSTV